MPETQSRENGAPPETAERDATKDAGNGQSSGLARGVKAALIATAVGGAVAAAARARGSSDADTSGGDDAPKKAEGESSGVRSAVQRASNRGEPMLSAAWEASRGTIEPFTRNGARQAGRFVAERSPDFVRETIIPPFVEGLTEERSGSGKKS